MAFNLTRLFATSVIPLRSVTQRGIKRDARVISIHLKEKQKKYFESLSEEEYHELHRRSNFSDWNYSSEIFAFGKRLHEEFPPELLVQAFTHRSYIVKEELKLQEMQLEDTKLNLQDNDALASDGEKIIRDFSGRYVSYFFPRFPLEGIESIANYLSSDEVLAYISKNLGTTHLILSKDYPVEDTTYSKTLKAIVGALNKCQGLQRSNLFVRDIIVSHLAGRDINDFLNISNYLEVLSEILKKDGKDPPEPRLICQAGMNTILANYHVGLYSNKQLIGHCSGESIETAVEMAALDALKRLFHTTDSCKPISYDVEEFQMIMAKLKQGEEEINERYSSICLQQICGTVVMYTQKICCWKLNTSLFHRVLLESFLYCKSQKLQNSAMLV